MVAARALRSARRLRPDDGCAGSRLAKKALKTIRYAFGDSLFRRGPSNKRRVCWAARFSTACGTVRFVLAVGCGASGARKSGGGGCTGMASTGTVTTGALSNLGADLSVSISFSVANELIDAARDSQMGDDELVAVLVTLVVGVTSAKRLVDRLSKAIASTARKSDDDAHEEEQRGLLEFVSLMLSIAQRIALSISVQVLAYSVKVNQPSRIVRITTLLGVVVFFVFFESAASRRS